MAFMNWDSLLPVSIELVAVHSPSRRIRMKKPPFGSVAEFAAHLVPVMETYLDRPYACFGHSLGSLVAFEVAQQLRREHRRLPAYLILSGRASPNTVPPGLGWHLMPDHQILPKLEEMGGTPPDILQNDELMQLFLPLLRTDVSLADGYRCAFSPEQVLPCGISAYNGLMDGFVDPAGVAQWQQYTQTEMRQRWFEGSHFYIQTAQQELLRAIGDDLNPYL